MQELVLTRPGTAAQNEWTRGDTEAETQAVAELRREFEEHLAECGPLAFRIARGVLRNSADAEDVAQDAVLRAYRRFARLRDRTRFRAWLVRITFRIALDRARSANSVKRCGRSRSRAPRLKISRHRANFRITWRAHWTNCRRNCGSSCCSRR
jgi:DNA-directed RNA polymerase specialized sigma24 family protein